MLIVERHMLAQFLADARAIYNAQTPEAQTSSVVRIYGNRIDVVQGNTVIAQYTSAASLNIPAAVGLLVPLATFVHNQVHDTIAQRPGRVMVTNRYANQVRTLIISTVNEQPLLTFQVSQ